MEGLVCRPQRVGQIWLPNLPKKFKEVVSRLQKTQETKKLVAGGVMVDDNLEHQECFALADKVAAMYKVGDIIEEVEVFNFIFPGVF